MDEIVAKTIALVISILSIRQLTLQNQKTRLEIEKLRLEAKRLRREGK